MNLPQAVIKTLVPAYETAHLFLLLWGWCQNQDLLTPRATTYIDRTTKTNLELWLSQSFQAHTASVDSGPRSQ